MAGQTPQPAFVYMVRCRNGSLYTGWTTDVQARFAAHASGHGARYTRAFGAVAVAYTEQLAGKSEALKREAAIKKLPREQKEQLCAQWAEQNAQSKGE